MIRGEYPMKVLFLGLGGIGQRHLRNLLFLVPDASVGAVRHANRTFEIGPDLRADPSINIIDKFNIQIFADMEEACGWEPDFAVVASPTSAHVNQTTHLVRSGIPVLLEKPISDSFEGLDELSKSIMETATPVMVGYMLRFHPGIQRLLKIVGEAIIGDLTSVHIQLCSYMPAWHPYEKYNEFYAGRKSLGGGAVLTEIHEIDLMHQMFGLPEKLWCVGGKLSPLEMDVEDTVSALFDYRFDDRILPVTLNMSFVQRPIGRTITLFGHNGRIHWDFIREEIVINDEEKSYRENFRVTQFDRNDMFIREMRHFIDCLQKGKTPIASFQEVVGGHIIALKMKESLEASSVINLN
jgi:predicted dehydrogenase